MKKGPAKAEALLKEVESSLPLINIMLGHYHVHDRQKNFCFAVGYVRGLLSVLIIIAI